jgi:hypothetical protein
VIDSLLTVTKGEVGWLAAFFLICVALDRLISAFTKLPFTLFALFALMIAAFFLVACVYTLGKWVLGHLRRGEDS